MTEVLKGNFADELKSRYYTYAMSTIMSRAVPDVRDGLKPVQRRLLYSMRLLHLDPEKAYKKSARVVGDVIGKYHPHGDQAVYDAMVRLAQDFSLRYPLVDGMGNFGSIDGDSPAAMRYTESRLTKVAKWIMKDLESGTVDYGPNYDGSDSEPTLMPCCFPNLLANGTNGIAVGMATSIPPHNITELCNALLAMLKKPEISDKSLLTHIKGPDLPTGGVLVETKEAMEQAYLTGRGGFRVRAKWVREELDRGQYQIVVTEIPYQVQKSKIIEKVADLIHAKKLPWLSDVRDESDENIRIVFEPKSRTVDDVALMEAMFRQCDLETRVALNMNVITSKGVPACLSLKETLQEFIDHRRNVLIRKSKWRLSKIAERLHLLDAYKVVYLNIDEVIQIIKTEDEPAPVMVERFNIDKIQADAILNMRLRKLRKLEEMEILREYNELIDEQSGLQNILASAEVQTTILTEEMKAIKKEFGDKRRTRIDDAPVAVVIPLEAQMEKEPLTVLLSKQGWIKALKGHSDDEVRYKEGDEEAFRLHVQSVNELCFLSSSGKVYTILASNLPAGRGFGEPLNLSIELLPHETITTVIDPTVAKKFLLATKCGFGFVIESNNLKSQTKNGKQVVNVGKNDYAIFCTPATGDMVAVSASTRRMLLFPLSEISTLAKGKGVKLMGIKDGKLETVCVYNSNAGLGFRNNIGTKDRIITGLDQWIGKRAQVGKVAPHGFQKALEFFVPDVPAEAIEEVSLAKTAEEIAQSRAKRAENAKTVDALVDAMVAVSDDEDEPDLFSLLDD